MKRCTEENINQYPLGMSFGEVAGLSSVFKIIHIRAVYSIYFQSQFLSKSLLMDSVSMHQNEKKNNNLWLISFTNSLAVKLFLENLNKRNASPVWLSISIRALK